MCKIKDNNMSYKLQSIIKNLPTALDTNITIEVLII